MKKTRLLKALSLILCIVLVAAIALFVTGCNDNKDSGTTTTNAPVSTDNIVLGEGSKTFDFKVVDVDGKETSFVIKTDKTIVGEALQDVELIAGEEGDYGLYVKTVNGITLDYNTDGKYWAFYVDGAYASSGVDTAEIVEGSVYSFKAE